MKKSFVVSGIIIIIIGVAGITYYIYKQQYAKENVPAAVDITKLAEESQQQVQSAQGASQQAVVQFPPELNIKMTFYSQAPNGNWDFPWQEACEEASILLIANTYYSHNWTKDQFNDQILKLVEWQNTNFGDYKDTNAEKISVMLKDYLGLKSVIHKDPTFEDVQKVLAQGHLIVMTFAGKEIGNPFYTNGGPLYHAMVIKGYKVGQKVITEDVGTRRGEDYVYQWKTLNAALHDYTVPIDDGAKLMIEVLPPSF